MAASASNYIPSRESDLVTFSTNFNTRIVASPTTYGLVAGQATAYTALHNAFTTAYQTANNPSTRTPINITAKDLAKAALIDGPGGIRALARIVQATPSVTPLQKQDLGLPVRDTEPTPVPVPDFAPRIDIVGATARTVRIRLHSSKAPSGNRGKPAGMDGATVFSFVGPEAPDEITQWKFEGNTTKTVVDVTFPATTPDGAKVWFTAYWFNPRAQSGPPSTPVSTNMPGGLSKAA